MTIQSFDPIGPLVGGALIGLAASLVLWAHGRVTGISGIYGGMLQSGSTDGAFRGWFMGGLLATGIVARIIAPSRLASSPGTSLVAVAVSGVLVGFGTRLGSGCTSGHGVCGLSRLSPRSLVATLTFMGAGALTVFLMGGAPGAQP